jgi:hypothetical protein
VTTTTTTIDHWPQDKQGYYHNLTRIADWGCPVFVETKLYHAKLARWPEPLQGLKLDSWLYALANRREHSDKVTGGKFDNMLVFEAGGSHE